MRILLDTNVVIDALAAREPFRRPAELIFLYCEKDGVTGCLSGNSLSDTYYLLRKHLSENAVRGHLGALMYLFDILPVGEEECSQALVSSIRDFEDAIQAACAKRFHIDYIITRDLSFLEQCPMAVTPSKFIEITGADS